VKVSLKRAATHTLLFSTPIESRSQIAYAYEMVCLQNLGLSNPMDQEASVRNNKGSMGAKDKQTAELRRNLRRMHVSDTVSTSESEIQIGTTAYCICASLKPARVRLV
jgi:hypothetical protein